MTVQNITIGTAASGDGILALDELRALANNTCQLSLALSAHAPVEAAANTVDEIVRSQRTVYGINTGFGKLATKRIPEDQLRALQRALVLSHAAGTGEPLDDATVGLILALKANALAKGYSGVRVEVIEALIALYNAGIRPLVPAKGSVGASGDLAPLAHLSLVLIGEGQARVDGEVVSGLEAMRRAGLEPLELGPKEGLALLNGTQVSTALALVGLFAAERLLHAATIAGAMSLDAAMGSADPFDPRIHAIRGHQAQSDVAQIFRDLLTGSAIRSSHVTGDDRVQDPYCLRCQPQVMGACLEQMRFATTWLGVEANAVSDNPLVFAETGQVLSGGNFHAEPVALAADGLALAIAEIGALSERRTAMLTDASISLLPPFLTPDAGVNSGFMIAQVTAAALASENKQLAVPASTDSLPTSANQEDHVSMATRAAYRLGEMARNTETIVAIELLAAAQGIDFRRPLTSSEPIERAQSLIRAKVPFRDADREMAPDITTAMDLVKSNAFAGLVTLSLVSE